MYTLSPKNVHTGKFTFEYIGQKLTDFNIVLIYKILNIYLLIRPAYFYIVNSQFIFSALFHLSWDILVNQLSKQTVM